MNPRSSELPPRTSWVATANELDRMIEDLCGKRDLAIDTEADSYFSYRVKLCLIQISTREWTYLVDPLSGVDVSRLGGLLADDSVQKVFHAGSNDIGLLRHHYGFRLRSIFDTMVAAQVLGHHQHGLAAFLKERFNVVTRKSFQTSDWRQRPLSSGQLLYASLDTVHLLELRDQLKAELQAKGREEEAREEFERLADSNHSERLFDPEAFAKLREARELDGLGLRLLSELLVHRDSVARERDRSPHRVFNDSTLLWIARRRPERLADLERAPGLPRYGTDLPQLLSVIAAAAKKGPLKPSLRRKRLEWLEPPLRGADRDLFEKLRDWRHQRATARGVSEARIATTSTLRAIAREHPASMEELAKLEGMLGFRVREFGSEILDLVRGAPTG